MADLNAKLRMELVDEVSDKAAKVEAALERIEQQAADVGAGSSGLDELAHGLDRAASSATALANRTRSIGDTTRSATLGFRDFSSQTSRGASQAATAIESFGAASGQAFSTAAAGSAALRRASRAQAFQLAANVNVVAELGYAFGQLTPATRGLGMAMAGAGGSAFALAGTFGVWGVAIGAVVGLLPGLIDLTRRLGTESRDSAEGIREARRAYEELRSSIRSAREERQRLDDIESGKASVRDIEEEIDVRRAQLRQARARRAEIADTERAIDSAKTRILGRAGAQVLDMVSNAVLRNLHGVDVDAVRRRVRETAAGDEQRAQTAMERAQRGLPVAQAREQEEARQEAARARREDAAAARRLLEEEVRRTLGTGRAADALLGQLTGPASPEGRVELRGPAARALSRAPSDAQARIMALAEQTLGATELARREEAELAQRRLSRAGGSLRGTTSSLADAIGAARITEESFDPGIDLASSRGRSAELRQEYIAALSQNPLARAAEAEARVEEGLARIGDGIDALNSGGATLVEVRVRGGAVEEATVSSRGGPPVEIDISGEAD